MSAGACAVRRPQTPLWNSAAAVLARRAFGFNKTRVCPLASGLSGLAAEEVVPAKSAGSAVRITDLPDHLLDEILAWLPDTSGKHTQARARAAAPGLGLLRAGRRVSAESPIFHFGA